jgi:predicted MarR family transcription regulator
MAPTGSIVAFAHVIRGLTNKSLRAQIAAHWRTDYTSAQATYDLRQLRLKGLIERIEGTNTYRVPPHGLRISAFFTQLATRVIVPTLTDLARPSRPSPRPLVAAWRTYERELDKEIRVARFAA